MFANLTMNMEITGPVCFFIVDRTFSKELDYSQINMLRGSYPESSKNTFLFWMKKSHTIHISIFTVLLGTVSQVFCIRFFVAEFDEQSS